MFPAVHAFVVSCFRTLLGQIFKFVPETLADVLNAVILYDDIASAIRAVRVRPFFK